MYDDIKIFDVEQCQTVVRPTSTRHMDPVLSHKKGDQCLNTNLLYQRTLNILSAIACPLVFDSINFLLQTKVSKSNKLQASAEGVNM